MKLRRNDTVLIIKGKDRGKTGKVVRINLERSKVLVEGLNQYKKHEKPSKKYPQGGIMDVSMPIEVSNVMLICPTCKKAARVKAKNTGREKRRACVKCGEVVDAAK